jgi:hypothetical protein
MHPNLIRSSDDRQSPRRQLPPRERSRQVELWFDRFLREANRGAVNSARDSVRAILDLGYQVEALAGGYRLIPTGGPR